MDTYPWVLAVRFVLGFREVFVYSAIVIIKGKSKQVSKDMD